MFNRLIFDGEMINFLERRGGRIPQILIHGMGGLISEEGNFIKRVDGTIDTLSYLPKSKFDIIQKDVMKDPFGPGIGRVNIKIGRFVRKFLNQQAFDEFSISDSDVEKFVNFYKSYFNFSEKNLKIVDGEDIKKYYLEENYFRPDGYRFGSLWNSCMRQSERNKFMTLYSLHPDKVKMLVFFSDCGKVRARALLWDDVREFDSNEVYKFMDRIYYVYDHDVNSLKKWAIDRGYLTKWEQNAKSELYLDVSGNCERKHLYVTLDNHNLSYYPYLDTFKYYNVREGRFSNSESFRFDWKLVQSSGRTYRVEEPEEEFYDDDNNEGDW
jgi:hypothetical protein